MGQRSCCADMSGLSQIPAVWLRFRYVVDVSLILASSSPRRHELFIAAGIHASAIGICDGQPGSGLTIR